MKKYALILLCLALVVAAGCGKQTAPETLPETTEAPTTLPTETTEPPTEPLPKTEPVAVLADKTPAVLTRLSRGSQVDVVKDYDETYVIVHTQAGYGLMEKCLLTSDTPYEPWTGYALWNKGFYDNYLLTGDPVRLLQTNTKIEVLDEYDGCCVVTVEDTLGYMKREDISKYRFVPSDGGGSSDGGGGGGGSSSGGQDGGDISLRAPVFAVNLSAIAQEGTVTGKATVKVDQAQVILAFFDRGEQAPVIVEPGFGEDWPGYTPVLLGELWGYIPQNLLETPESQAFQEWSGYARYNAALYDNFYLRGNATRLGTNTAIQVLNDLETCFLVRCNDTLGFMAKDSVSQYPISVGGGSSESSGDSGGGGGGGDEWTPPVL